MIGSLWRRKHVEQCTASATHYAKLRPMIAKHLRRIGTLIIALTMFLKTKFTKSQKRNSDKTGKTWQTCNS